MRQGVVIVMCLFIFVTLAILVPAGWTGMVQAKAQDRRYIVDRVDEVENGRVIVIYDSHENLCYPIYRSYSSGTAILLDRTEFCHTRLQP